MNRPYVTGCIQHCNSGADCTQPGHPCTGASPSPTTTPPEAGNVHLPDPGPRPPMTPGDVAAVGVLLILSAVSAVGMLGWLVDNFGWLADKLTSVFGATP